LPASAAAVVAAEEEEAAMVAAEPTISVAVAEIENAPGLGRGREPEGRDDTPPAVLGDSAPERLSLGGEPVRPEPEPPLPGGSRVGVEFVEGGAVRGNVTPPSGPIRGHQVRREAAGARKMSGAAAAEEEEKSARVRD
jgi:hypothetical protein